MSSPPNLLAGYPASVKVGGVRHVDLSSSPPKHLHFKPSSSTPGGGGKRRTSMSKPSTGAAQETEQGAKEGHETLKVDKEGEGGYPRPE
ncbi:BZ3500_MvSof-1268-A1-R1_Chr12-3g04018 [Microbotryum saponariae]|uniref:BZ3500_MvSof-1268-A1-R1_Chr12-3g04018 protein n=1 Tax=Microbotryum saponariae TaxID=289078 RepID=A0A2X0MQC8_9BASI|nr:BZ3500_MvSof-1268-A1-R1_Chr12-3g04018 [Microbotryum saponariae]SDA02547.1 BZ3501_MvSof-1269-A2-R1_Chr12-3g03673 [Microbotryum saponariae]